MSPEYDDMILPEGFNPELGDANFDEDGSLIDTPVAAEPTTADAAQETPQNVEQPEVTPATESTIAQEPVQETPAAPIPQTVKVRFNHEDRELSLDEAALYAQKGMNYDRMEQKYKEMEQRFARYDETAKMFGHENADSMMTEAESKYVDNRVQELVSQGNTDAMARFLVNQEIAKFKASRPAAPAAQPAPVRGLTPERKAELDEFNAAYPEVTKIPDEVFRLHSDGVRLKTAYEIYQGKQALEAEKAKYKAAQDELAILRQNQASAAKGPVTGTVGKAAEEKEKPDDPFLIGFDKDY